jgi:tetratricopeptide (TPR) repeat protein
VDYKLNDYRLVLNMSLDLTPDQLHQIESLGISLTPKKGPLLPILSVSGLTLVSFGGIFLLKSKLNASPAVSSFSPLQTTQPSPTQVPKSIQHYLLTSQQYFTQALQTQKQNSGEALNYLNQAILAATDAVKEFPDDYRGYEQRGRIYQSLLGSQPQLLTAAIADFSAAAARNPTSAELTRTLATLYARQGDPRSTLNYLTATINLDPTTAQNFYDLARLEQQVGLIPDALATYDRLLTIVADPAQKQAVTLEKSALEKLVSQNPAKPVSDSPTPSVSSKPPAATTGPLIQADAGTGLIIAAPETSTNITVSNLSTSNSLSGDGTLPSGQTQITLTNSSLTPSAQIYIAVVSSAKNSNLQLLSRSGNKFTVGLDSPAAQDTTFKWWIVKP